MYGPGILVRTLSLTTRPDRNGARWQYHPRSDHHSKVACWGIVFDLMRKSNLIRDQVKAGALFFGINHEMRDFAQDRKKNLDLVLCSAGQGKSSPLTLVSLGAHLQVQLSEQEQAELQQLPVLRQAPVGSVFMALEAKACMTAHQRALPRLYDELNSSHQTVHGATNEAIAAGFAMVNAAPRFLSPTQGTDTLGNPKWSSHNQPRDAQLVVDKIRQIRRRSRVGDAGYDAFSIVLVSCANDGTAVELIESEAAPADGDIYNYGSMINRLVTIYSTRFANIG